MPAERSVRREELPSFKDLKSRRGFSAADACSPSSPAPAPFTTRPRVSEPVLSWVPPSPRGIIPARFQRAGQGIQGGKGLFSHLTCKQLGHPLPGARDTSCKHPLWHGRLLSLGCSGIFRLHGAGSLGHGEPGAPALQGEGWDRLLAVLGESRAGAGLLGYDIS